MIRRDIEDRGSLKTSGSNVLAVTTPDHTGQGVSLLPNCCLFKNLPWWEINGPAGPANGRAEDGVHGVESKAEP